MTLTRKLKLFFLGLAFFVVPLAIILGCVEATLRYLDTRNVREFPNYAVNAADMPMKIKSNYRGSVGGIPIATNRYGLRDEPDFDTAPAADQFRILSMGDSIAFGLGIKSQDSYAKVLERKLNEGAGRARYHVINSAGPGYSPSSYYLFLKNEALSWRPRVVLVQIEPTNDVTDEALLRWELDRASPDRPKALRGGRYIVAWDGTILASYIRGPYFYEKTYTYIELSRGLFNLLYRLAPPKPLPPDSGGVYYVMGHEAYLMDQTRIESGWARMLASLKAVNDLLRLHDVSPLVVIMPSRFAFDPPTESPQNRFARGLVNRAVEFARQNDIPYLDLTETIAAVGGEKVYLDTVHPNEKGNLAVGSALYEYLKTRVGP